MDCQTCKSYNHGNGQPACLKCPKYRDILAKSGKRRTIKIEPVPQNILEAIADETSSISNIMDAIRLLPPDLAAIISMIYFAGLTTRDIGAMLKISQSTVIKKNKFAIEIIRESLS
jgi:RNA polymerase sigma factor (sigma-70 family)